MTAIVVSTSPARRAVRLSTNTPGCMTGRAGGGQRTTLTHSTGPHGTPRCTCRRLRLRAPPSAQPGAGEREANQVQPTERTFRESGGARAAVKHAIDWVVLVVPGPTRHIPAPPSPPSSLEEASWPMFCPIKGQPMANGGKRI
ncbi:MAG: hypothetical protein ACPIOQ_44650 [Promethearchaeia archaeon]